MAVRRLFRRLLFFFLFLCALLAMSYISTTNVGSWNHVANSSLHWSTIDNLSSSLFVGAANVTYLRRGPAGVVVDIRPKCPGRANSDSADLLVCRPLLAGNVLSNTRPGWNIIPTREYAERTANCDCFRSDFSYFVSAEDITHDELRFPIAFSLLTYENLEQTERLLRLIYRPQNIYCIHVDAKSSRELHKGLQAIANCFDNVFIAKPPVSTIWGKVSVVHAEMLCMRRLLDIDKRWTYLINLVGRDFPLRTNYELVKILKAYNGANDVQASRNGEQ